MIIKLIDLNELTGKWEVSYWECANQQDYVARLWNQEDKALDVSRWNMSDIQLKLSELNYKPIVVPELESKVAVCKTCGWSIFHGKNGDEKEGICYECYKKQNPLFYFKR